MTPAIILHHYARSPFAEKVRLALGLKDLPYRSVTVPRWMPKPDLVALTGGYRRTPVMQVGADIYCDTLLILEQIERLHPAPTLYPDGAEGAATALGWWVEKSIFVPAIGLTRGLAEAPSSQELLDDRRAFFGFDIDKDTLLQQQSVFLQRLTAHLSWIALMLRDGRDFLLGNAPSVADLSAYHPLWFLFVNCGEAGARLLPGFDALRPWYDRVGTLGHGRPHEISAADALAIAADAAPLPVTAADDVPLAGCRPGERIGVTPDDAGRDTVMGLLVASPARRIVLRRSDPMLGVVNVHFPRAGFDAIPA